jgi:homoserine O-acetyltransferase|tara:strand:+ start:490 stop:1701 length:1212 start_codon:yes stop_codon:yes gene_type:complete
MRVFLIAIITSLATPLFAYDGIVEPQTFTIAELELINGETISPVSVVYQTYGTLDPDGRNGILILHGMGGTAHAAGRYTPDGSRGYWDELIGPGKTFDTDKYFVISPQALAGGHRDNKPGSGTTGPHSVDPKTGQPYGVRFPVFTIRDMVVAHKKLLDHLGVRHLVVVSGISMGGYQALELITTYPKLADGAIPVVARGRSPAQHMANHLVRRTAIMNDPDWQDGDYYGTDQYPSDGMAIAALTSTASYNGSALWYENNILEYDVNRSPYDNFGNNFEMEEQLLDSALTRSETNIDANCYLYQSRALTTQNLGYGRGHASTWREALANGLRLAEASVLMMPSRTDGSVQPRFAAEIVDILQTLGKPAKLHVIDSERGHSGSRDFYQMIPVMTEFISGLPGAKQ